MTNPKENGKVPAKRNPILRWVYKTFLEPATGDTLRQRTQTGSIANMIGPAPGFALDLGCGAGLLTPRLARKADKVIAVEFGAENIAYNRLTLRYENRINYSHIRADARFLPLADAYFDTILCSEVIEHIREDNVVERQMHRLLKPGGHAVISVPMPPDPEFDPCDIEPGGHVRAGYDLDGILALFPPQRWRLLFCQYRMLIFSRMIFKSIIFLKRHFGIRLPAFITHLAHLDRLFYFKPIWFKPYDLIVKFQKIG